MIMHIPATWNISIRRRLIFTCSNRTSALLWPTARRLVSTRRSFICWSLIESARSVYEGTPPSPPSENMSRNLLASSLPDIYHVNDANLWTPVDMDCSTPVRYGTASCLQRGWSAVTLLISHRAYIIAPGIQCTGISLRLNYADLIMRPWALLSKSEARVIGKMNKKTATRCTSGLEGFIFKFMLHPLLGLNSAQARPENRSV